MHQQTEMFAREPGVGTLTAGRLEAIYLAGARGAPRAPVSRVRAVAGAGLEGDRYFARGRIFAAGRQVTLIEAEAVEAAVALGGVLQPGEARRNLLTRGIRLNPLVGREFRVGEVLLRGVELCHPCSRLARLTYREVERHLHLRGGLRAEVLRGGELAVGDAVEPA